MSPSDRQTGALFSRMIATSIQLVERVAIARWQRDIPAVATLEPDFTVRVALPGGVAERVYSFWIDGLGQVHIWERGSKPPAAVAAELVLADTDHVPDGASDGD